MHGGKLHALPAMEQPHLVYFLAFFQRPSVFEQCFGHNLALPIFRCKEYSQVSEAVVRVAVKVHNIDRKQDAATEMQLSFGSLWLLP